MNDVDTTNSEKNNEVASNNINAALDDENTDIVNSVNSETTSNSKSKSSDSEGKMSQIYNKYCTDENSDKLGSFAQWMVDSTSELNQDSNILSDKDLKQIEKYICECMKVIIDDGNNMSISNVKHIVQECVKQTKETAKDEKAYDDKSVNTDVDKIADKYTNDEKEAQNMVDEDMNADVEKVEDGSILVLDHHHHSPLTTDVNGGLYDVNDEILDTNGKTVDNSLTSFPATDDNSASTMIAFIVFVVGFLVLFSVVFFGFRSRIKKIFGSGSGTRHKNIDVGKKDGYGNITGGGCGSSSEHFSDGNKGVIYQNSYQVNRGNGSGHGFYSQTPPPLNTDDEHFLDGNNAYANDRSLYYIGSGVGNGQPNHNSSHESVKLMIT